MNHDRRRSDLSLLRKSTNRAEEYSVGIKLLSVMTIIIVLFLTIEFHEPVLLPA